MKKNALYLQVLLLLLISLNTGFAHANKALTSQEKVGIGLMHALKNEKKQAWEVLFPEAKAGNVDAMFHLGQLMARSPEFPNHLQKAKTFFTAAHNKGHKGAGAMLKMVDQQIELKSGSGKKMIAGKSALPTPVDIEKARIAVARQQALHGRFTDSSDDQPAEVTVHVFISNEITFADKVADNQNVLKGRYGDKIRFKYHVVIDQTKWNQKFSFVSSGTPNNMIGFEPDMNGSLAASKGVRRTPAIVIELMSGKRISVQSPEEINTELAGIIK